MSDFDLVKSQVDIVSYIQRNVDLKKTGNVYKASCPFHTEKSPSFVVNPTLQRWQCFGACGVGGSIIDFAMRFHGMSEAEALQDVAAFGNIQLTPLNREMTDKRERLYALMQEAADYYDALLYTGGPRLDYLQKERGLSAEIIKAAKIGYAPGNMMLYKQMTQLGYTFQDMLDAGLIKQGDNRPYDTFSNRIVVPIRDMKGRIVAFTGRAMSAAHGPKYLHNTNTDIFHKSSIIHRMPQFDTRRGADAFKTVVIVEGSIDPISAANRGVYNVVSILGKELSDDQMDLLIKTGAERLVFCLDKDESGRKALRKLTEKHIARLASKGIGLYAMFAPHGKDPDDTFREMPDLWEPAVNAAQPVVSVLIDLEMAALDVNPSGADKTKLVNHLLPVLKSDNPFIEDENIKTLADKVGIAFDRLKGWAHPQMHVMDKPVPAPKVESIGLPTTEEWVLHGILTHEADSWLVRANSCLFIASDSPMPYALAPLSAQDFTDPQTRRFFEISAKSQAAEEMIRGNIDKSLEATYERIKGLNTIGDALGIPFDYDIFISHVYELRLKRLRKERPTFEGKDVSKARECAMAIACLQLAAEEMI